MAPLSAALQSLVLGAIQLYQWLLSPLLGPCCRFHPSCSKYASQAFKRFGFAKGLLLTVKRVIRCHPWNPGGLDPVPNEDKR